MTMHLIKGASSLNTRKPQAKITAAKYKELEAEWRSYNKRMRQRNMHKFQIKTIEEYIDYSYGKTQIKKEFKPYEPQKSFRRSTPNYPSAAITPRDPASAQMATAKKENQKYTGTLVKGIATMHKSNAIPVIDDEQARDLARMRRG